MEGRSVQRRQPRACLCGAWEGEGGAGKATAHLQISNRKLEEEGERRTKQGKREKEACGKKANGGRQRPMAVAEVLYSRSPTHCCCFAARGRGGPKLLGQCAKKGGALCGAP